jgi:16S rRNA (adenine1518-N6/adenine1519-N6)-dimethyltransferase
MNHLSAKKSLGQHFLRSKDAIKKIIVAADITPGDVVLEVGPGEGVLTEALLNAGAHVTAIEKDKRCISLLEERFRDAIEDGHLLLIEGDVLNKKLRNELFLFASDDPIPYKVVANIPYYITGMLFRLFLEQTRQPSALIFLVQKEVAEHLIARNGKEGILSLSVKIYGDPHYIAKVSRDAFTPKPRVDSAIITVTNISQKRLQGLTDGEYFRVVKAGLGAKRKMLLGNLARELNIPKEKLLALFATLKINEKIRGEDLSIATWITLAKAVI